MKLRLIFPILSFLLLLPCVATAQTQAEVIVTSTFLRTSPDYGAEKLRTLEKGSKVNIEKGREASGWTYVSLEDGKIKGWILSATIQLIKSVEKTNDKPAAVKTEVVPKTPTAPQKNEIQTPAEEIVENDDEALLIDTEEVSLNIRVVNSQNRPVGSLDESAFRVYEDGVLQPITSLTMSEVPIFNALVIDNSRSLRTQLSKVIEAAKAIVSANKPADETTVVRFVSADKIEVVQPFTPKRNLIDNALDNLFSEGGQTAIIDAVYKTAEMVEKYQNTQKKEDVKLRALILVTDGDDRGSRFSEKQLFELLRNSYVQIYAIGFTDNLSDVSEDDGQSRRQKARAFLTRLAQETGGKVYFPPSAEALSAISGEIAAELRTQYVVSYSPTNTTRDGSFRRITIDVSKGSNGETRNAVTRTGRNAPKN